MSPSRLKFKLDGDGVTPSTVDMLDLARLMQLVYHLVRSVESGDGSFKLSLVGVEEGSDNLILEASQSAEKSYIRVAQAIADDAPYRLPKNAQRHLKSVWRFLQARTMTVVS